MKKGYFRKRVPFLIIFVFFTLIGIIAFVLSLRYGIVRDEYYSYPHPEPFYVKYGLVLCLALSLLSVFLCLCLYRKLESASKLKRIFTISSTILICLCALTEYLCWDYQNKVIEQEQQSFIRINLEELKDISDDNKSCILYVGREGCSACENELVEMDKLFQKNKISVFYYDTTNDRENKAQEMYAILEDFQIKLVPTILIIKNGEIIESFLEKPVEQLKHYLKLS